MSNAPTKSPRNVLCGPASESHFAGGRPPVVHALLRAQAALASFRSSVEYTRPPAFILTEVWDMLGVVDKYLHDFCVDPRHPLRKHMHAVGLIDREGFELQPAEQDFASWRRDQADERKPEPVA
jgi:hypothetical protein